MRDSSETFLNLLGKSQSLKIIVQSIFFAVILIFYVLHVGSYFGPTVYPLIERVTYSTQFVEKYLISESFDSVIIILLTIAWVLLTFSGKPKVILATIFTSFFFLSFIPDSHILLTNVTLVTLPMILISIMAQKFSPENFIIFNRSLSLNYVAILAIALGAISLSITIPTFFVADLSLPSVNFLYYIHLLFTIFTPILILAISLCFPIKFLIVRLQEKKTKQTLSKYNNLDSNASINKKKIAFYLLVILLLCILVTIIPHMPTINPDGQNIGDDTADYKKFLDNIASSQHSVFGILREAFVYQSSGDRAVSLLLFFIFSQLYDPTNFATSLEFLPILLGPVMMLCTFVLTREITNNYTTSLIAALLTIPFYVLIGLYAGLYANSLALIFGYLAIYCLFKYLKNKSKLQLIMFSVMILLVHFSHAPTWTILLLVLIIFFFLIFIRKTEKWKTSLMMFIALLPSIIVDISKIFLMNTSGVIENVSFANTQGFGFHGLNTIWYNLVDTTQIYMAGLIASPLLLFLVVYWIFICSPREKFTTFFMVFCTLPILPILFGEAEITTRLLYEIPFQIPAAIALTKIKDQNGILIFVVICFWIIVICLRSASNFYFNPIL